MPTSDKIVFLCLHFISFSHLICFVRGLMFLVKVENVKSAFNTEKFAY